jgi:hypothetical protein
MRQIPVTPERPPAGKRTRQRTRGLTFRSIWSVQVLTFILVLAIVLALAIPWMITTFTALAHALVG